MANSAEYESRMNQRRAKRKKKKKRSWFLKGIAAGLLLYLLLSIIFSFRTGLSTTIALKGTVREEILTDGYVFRDQSVILAPVSGYLEARVMDGERVKEGQTIGHIYTGAYDPERSQKIQNLSERIARLESGAATNTYAGSTVMAEQKIGLAARDLSDLRAEHNIENLVAQKEYLNLLIEKKKAMQDGGTEESGALLVSLQNQLWELESGMEGTKTALTANMSGVFCARIDGLEERLTMQTAKEVTVGMLEELDRLPLQREEEVLQDKPVCKVVNNYGWCYSANIKAEDAAPLQVGKKIRLRFFELSDTTVYGTIQSISPEENGKVAVTIYINRYVEGIYALSRASAEIITVSEEGIKVPIESLHVRNEQTGVYVLRLGVARFVPVRVQYKNDAWAILSPVLDTADPYKLQIYDEVIVSARNLEDGKVVR